MQKEGKLWRDKNKDKINKSKKLYYLLNKNTEKFKVKRAEYRLKESYKISKRVSNHKRNDRKRTTDDKTINGESLKQLLVKQNYRCNKCKAMLNLMEKRKVHLDHIIPLSKYGIHSIKNVQWLCQYCNIIKHNK